MSLNICLQIKKHISYDECKSWEEDFEIVFDANITHNLNMMAIEADLYQPLWHPQLLYCTKASDLIDHLKKGLCNLNLDPDKYRKLEPENKWGTYEGLNRFTLDYLDACIKYPNSVIIISR